MENNMKKLKIFFILVILTSLVSILFYQDVLQANKQVFNRVSVYKPYSKSMIELLEHYIFLNNTTNTTDPVNSQLFYADMIKMVSYYKIGKDRLCSNKPLVKTVIYVLSRVNAFNQRNAIRHTWAKFMPNTIQVSLLTQ